LNKTKKTKYVRYETDGNIPPRYIKMFNKFQEFEEKKMNRILQEDLEYFKRKIPKKYKDRFILQIARGLW